MYRRPLLIIILTIVLAGCGLVYIEDPDCPLEESNKYILAHDLAMDEFIDAEADVGRANDLEDWYNAIGRMESSLELIQAASPPVCLEEVHSSMVDGMDAEITSYRTAFDGNLELAEEWFAIAERAFDQHDKAMDTYNERVIQNAPRQW